MTQHTDHRLKEWIGAAEVTLLDGAGDTAGERFAWLATGLGITCADRGLYGVGWRWGPKLFEYRWVQKVMSAERRAVTWAASRSWAPTASPPGA